jgi:hypothetical protein
MTNSIKGFFKQSLKADKYDTQFKQLCTDMYNSQLGIKIVVLENDNKGLRDELEQIKVVMKDVVTTSMLVKEIEVFTITITFLFLIVLILLSKQLKEVHKQTLEASANRSTPTLPISSPSSSPPSSPPTLSAVVSPSKTSSSVSHAFYDLNTIDGIIEALEKCYNLENTFLAIVTLVKGNKVILLLKLQLLALY